MINKLFDSVSGTLQKAADKTGLTYEQINVYSMFAWIGLTVALAIRAFKK